MTLRVETGAIIPDYGSWWKVIIKACMVQWEDPFNKGRIRMMENDKLENGIFFIRSNGLLIFFNADVIGNKFSRERRT